MLIKLCTDKMPIVLQHNFEFLRCERQSARIRCSQCLNRWLLWLQGVRRELQTYQRVKGANQTRTDLRESHEGLNLTRAVSSPVESGIRLSGESELAEELSDEWLSHRNDLAKSTQLQENIRACLHDRVLD